MCAAASVAFWVAKSASGTSPLSLPPRGLRRSVWQLAPGSTKAVRVALSCLQLRGSPLACTVPSRHPRHASRLLFPQFSGPESPSFRSHWRTCSLSCSCMGFYCSTAISPSAQAIQGMTAAAFAVFWIAKSASAHRREPTASFLFGVPCCGRSLLHCLVVDSALGLHHSRAELSDLSSRRCAHRCLLTFAPLVITFVRLSESTHLGCSPSFSRFTNAHVRKDLHSSSECI